MSVPIEIAELNQECLRVRNAFIAISDHYLDSEKKGAAELPSIFRHFIILSIAWDEINQAIQFDGDNVPVIPTDWETEWNYYRLPGLAIEVDHLTSIFDVCKTIEGLYDLSSRYNTASDIDLPIEEGQSSTPSAPSIPSTIAADFLTRDVQLKGLDSLGGFEKDEWARAGVSSTDWVERLMQNVIHPSYIAPSITIYSSIMNPYNFVEPGSLLDVRLASRFNQNDAGVPTLFKYTKIANDWESDEGEYPDDTAHIFNDIYFEDPDEIQTLKEEVWYEAGSIKQNNVPEYDAEGQILAGSVSRTFPMKCLMPAFVGVTVNYPTSFGDFRKDLNTKIFMSADTIEVEGSLDTSSGQRVINVFVPPGWVLDKDASYIKQSNGFSDPIWQDGNPNSAFLIISDFLTGDINSASAGSYTGKPYSFKCYSGFSLLGFTQLTYKIIIKK